MAEDPKLLAAEVQVARSRARLLATVEELAAALEPRKLVREMWEGAKIKGADLAEEAVDAVKARPMATGGALAALAVFLARAPLLDLAGKLASKDKPADRRPPAPPRRERASAHTTPDDKRSTGEPTAAPRAASPRKETQ